MEHRSAKAEQCTHAGRMGRWNGVVAPLALLTALCALVAACGGTPTASLDNRPPPRLFFWSQQATLNSQTPQEAYAAAMDLTPCVGEPSATPGRGNPPVSTIVSWLISTRNYGLATIQVDCNPPGHSFHRWLFELFRDSTGAWSPQGGYIADNWSTNATVTVSPPKWLNLPTDTYNYFDVMQPGTNESPEVSVVNWDAQTRLFVFGHIADQAIRPDGATLVALNGASGWMTIENGLVSITTVRTDGSTLFFSGTATPAETQTLAESAFAHVNEALQPLQTSTTTSVTPGATSP